MTRFFTLVAIVLLISCTDSEPASSPVNAPIALDTEDPRFEIYLDRSAEAALASPVRQLVLRVQPKEGWHIEPKAPTHLDFNSAPDIEVHLSFRAGLEDMTRSAEVIEFAVSYPVTDGDMAIKPGDSVEGQLKFGVCREGNPRCEIVHREIQVPIH